MALKSTPCSWGASYPSQEDSLIWTSFLCLNSKWSKPGSYSTSSTPSLWFSQGTLPNTVSAISWVLKFWLSVRFLYLFPISLESPSCVYFQLFNFLLFTANFYSNPCFRLKIKYSIFYGIAYHSHSKQPEFTFSFLVVPKHFMGLVQDLAILLFNVLPLIHFSLLNCKPLDLRDHILFVCLFLLDRVSIKKKRQCVWVNKNTHT